jgi:hypothetical protein
VEVYEYGVQRFEIPRHDGNMFIRFYFGSSFYWGVSRVTRMLRTAFYGEGDGIIRDSTKILDTM